MTYRNDRVTTDRCPDAVFVENTNICNLRCIMCPIEKMTRPRGSMSMEMFRRVCDEIAEKFGDNTRMNFYFFGEPFVPSEALSMIAYAKSLSIRMEFSTNLQLLNEETIRSWLVLLDEHDTIVVSLDAYSDHEYESIRVGGSYARLLQNYRFLVKAYQRRRARKPMIHAMCHYDWEPDRTGLNHPITGPAGMERVRAFAQTFIRETWGVLGRRFDDGDVDRVVASLMEKCGEGMTWHYIDERIGLWIRKLINFAMQIGGSDSQKGKGDAQRYCDFPWRTLVVLWNGDVAICCMDMNGTQVVGNVNESSLSEIWNGPKIQQLRREFLEGRAGGICRDCSGL